MAALETLEILIEADRSGLESQLKSAANSIQSFVSQMNNQEVSWTQILSKSITPALMATIASTFAIAITQALQFQDAMQNSSLSSANSLATNSSAMTDSVYGISNATGKSAVDVANAMGIVQQTFKDTAASQDILNVVTEEASIRNEDATKMAAQLVPLLQEWGIDSGPAAAQATATLNDAVKNGVISFDDLVNGLTAAGPALRNYTDLGTAASQVEIASAVPGMDAGSALASLQQITNGITQGPTAAINQLVGNMKNIVSNSGLAGAFEAINTSVKGYGDVASAVLGGIFDTSTIQHYKDTSSDAFNNVGKDADVLLSHVEPLSVQMQDAMTATKQLNVEWDKLENTLAKFAAPAGISALLVLLQGMNDAIDFTIDALTTLFGLNFWDQFVSNSSNANSTASSIGFQLPNPKDISSALGTNNNSVNWSGSQPNVSNNTYNNNINVTAPEGGAKNTAASIFDFNQTQASR